MCIAHNFANVTQLQTIDSIEPKLNSTKIRFKKKKILKTGKLKRIAILFSKKFANLLKEFTNASSKINKSPKKS